MADQTEAIGTPHTDGLHAVLYVNRSGHEAITAPMSEDQANEMASDMEQQHFTVLSVVTEQYGNVRMKANTLPEKEREEFLRRMLDESDTPSYPQDDDYSGEDWRDSQYRQTALDWSLRLAQTYTQASLKPVTAPEVLTTARMFEAYLRGDPEPAKN